MSSRTLVIRRTFYELVDDRSASSLQRSSSEPSLRPGEADQTRAAWEDVDRFVEEFSSPGSPTTKAAFGVAFERYLGRALDKNDWARLWQSYAKTCIRMGLRRAFSRQQPNRPPQELKKAGQRTGDSTVAAGKKITSPRKSVNTRTAGMMSAQGLQSYRRCGIGGRSGGRRLAVCTVGKRTLRALYVAAARSRLPTCVA